jgi:hypothetical protein
MCVFIVFLVFGLIEQETEAASYMRRTQQKNGTSTPGVEGLRGQYLHLPPVYPIFTVYPSFYPGRR